MHVKCETADRPACEEGIIRYSAHSELVLSRIATGQKTYRLLLKHFGPASDAFPALFTRLVYNSHLFPLFPSSSCSG